MFDAGPEAEEAVLDTDTLDPWNMMRHNCCMLMDINDTLEAPWTVAYLHFRTG